MTTLSDIIENYHPVQTFNCRKQDTCPITYFPEKPKFRRKKHTLYQRENTNEYHMFNDSSKGLLNDKINTDKKKTLVKRRYNSKDFDKSRSRSKKPILFNSKDSVETSSTNDLNINCAMQTQMDINSLDLRQKKLTKLMTQDFNRFSEDIAKIQYNQYMMDIDIDSVKKQLIQSKQVIQKLINLTKAKSSLISKKKQGTSKQKALFNPNERRKKDQKIDQSRHITKLM